MENLELEIKARLLKYEAKEERILGILKNCQVPLIQERLSGQAQILNETIWDLRHLLKLLTATPEVKPAPEWLCPSCRECYQSV